MKKMKNNVGIPNKINTSGVYLKYIEILKNI
jgi:hypothetical protein